MPLSPANPPGCAGLQLGDAAAPDDHPTVAGALQAMLQWKAKTLAEQPKFFSPTRQREQELFELGYRRVAGGYLRFVWPETEGVAGQRLGASEGNS